MSSHITRRQARAARLRYIAEERKRYAKLEKARRAYDAAARKRGLHALTRTEIIDRERELTRMEAEADTVEWQDRQVEVARFMAGRAEP